MSFWSAAVIIVAIWAFVQLYTRRHDRDLGVTRDEDGNPVFAPPRDDQQVRAEIDILRERLEVLERIATDANSEQGRETRRLSPTYLALICGWRPYGQVAPKPGWLQLTSGPYGNDLFFSVGGYFSHEHLYIIGKRGFLDE